MFIVKKFNPATAQIHKIYNINILYFTLLIVQYWATVKVSATILTQLLCNLVIHQNCLKQTHEINCPSVQIIFINFMLLHKCHC